MSGFRDLQPQSDNLASEYPLYLRPTAGPVSPRSCDLAWAVTYEWLIFIGIILEVLVPWPLGPPKAFIGSDRICQVGSLPVAN
jgi:hypothetical protein